MLSSFSSLTPFGRPRFAPSGGGSGPPATGMLFRLKAESFGLADNTALTSLTDSSGNGRDFTGSNATLKTGILNGKAVMRFAGSGQFTLSTSLSIGHVYAIAKYSGGSTFGNYQGLFGGDDYSGDITWTGGAGGTQWYGPSYTLYLDGAATNEAGPGSWHYYEADRTPSAQAGFCIGNDRTWPFTGRFWDGDIAEIIAYGTQSGGDITATRAYINSEYGL